MQALVNYHSQLETIVLVSLKQSKQIYVVPYITSESESMMAETRLSVYIDTVLMHVLQVHLHPKI